MPKLTNKKRDRLRVEGDHLIFQQSEVYREANQAFAHELLAALRRCRNFAGYPPVVLDGEPPQCGCPDCTRTRALMTTHLRSIAIGRAIVDDYMKRLGQALGTPLTPLKVAP